MTDDIQAIDVETAETVTVGEVLELARAGRVRGLPRLADLPAGGWYSRQARTLAGGVTAVYLMWRWPDPDSNRLLARSLGRIG